MTIRALHSTATDPNRAVEELHGQLGDMVPAFLVFFTTPRHDPERLGAALRDHFPVPSIGCTTAGEIAAGRMLDGSIVGMALDAEHVERAAVQSIGNATDEEQTAQAYQALVAAFGSREPTAETLGLVLHDGLAASEERVMSTLSTLSNVPFIGGSAGDEARFVRTLTYVNGRPSSGGAALALLQLKKRHQLLKTQSFAVTDKTLTVTKATGGRRIQELNGCPAAEEYARALGVNVTDLPSRFMRNPVAVLVGGEEPFVRSPRLLDGNDVLFYCEVQEGTELRVLESRNIVEDTSRDLKAALSAFGPVSGVINFHCILRTLELKERGQMDAYGALFQDLPAVGFCTYGESYIGHINQTSTMILFE